MRRSATWRWCLVAGLVAFGCSVGFGLIPGMRPCGDIGGVGPILAFEVARTPAEIALLFGSEPCRSTLIAAQRTGLWLDALAFIPSYTAFLCLAAWATQHRWRRWIVVALSVAALADEVEGFLLFAILRDLSGTPGLDALFWAVRAKFVLLILGTACVAWTILAAGLTNRRPAALLAIAVAAPMPLALRSFGAGRPAAMTTHFTVSWTMLLLIAVVGAFWLRLLAAPLPAPDLPSA